MIAKLIKWYFKALWWMVIFVVPFFTLWFPVMPVYDWLKPWDEAVAALKNEKEEGLRWMVGFETNGEYINGELIRYEKSRDFVVFPAVFTTPDIYEFSEGTGIEKGLEVRPYGALGYLAMYVVMVAFSWLVSLRKIKSLFRKSEESG